MSYGQHGYNLYGYSRDWKDGHSELQPELQRELGTDTRRKPFAEPEQASTDRQTQAGMFDGNFLNIPADTETALTRGTSNAGCTEDGEAGRPVSKLRERRPYAISVANMSSVPITSTANTASAPSSQAPAALTRELAGLHLERDRQSWRYAHSGASGSFGGGRGDSGSSGKAPTCNAPRVSRPKPSSGSSAPSAPLATPASAGPPPDPILRQFGQDRPSRPNRASTSNLSNTTTVLPRRRAAPTEPIAGPSSGKSSQTAAPETSRPTRHSRSDRDGNGGKRSYRETETRDFQRPLTRTDGRSHRRHTEQGGLRAGHGGGNSGGGDSCDEGGRGGGDRRSSGLAHLYIDREDGTTLYLGSVEGSHRHREARNLLRGYQEGRYDRRYIESRTSNRSKEFREDIQAEREERYGR